MAARLRDADTIAIDTEFHAERRYMPKLYLVQLHVAGVGTWLVDPLQPGHLDAIGPALLSRPWLLHGGEQDLRILGQRLGGLPEAVFDTQIAAALVDLVWPAPYGQLARTWLGVHVEKEATLSDWSRRPLTAGQLHYAAEDVSLLPSLWDRLATQARSLDRADLLTLACGEARAKAMDPPSADVLWREVAAARVLEPHEAVVLQELCVWRESLARSQDTPAWSILGDGLLTDLARRRPITVESLASNRRLPRAVVRDHGEGLVDRIQRASNRPEWAWPRPVSSTSPAGRMTRWLRCWAHAMGHERRWAADLALPKHKAEDLASTRPDSRESLAIALGPWRDDLLGDDLWTALLGGSSLTLLDDVSIVTTPGPF